MFDIKKLYIITRFAKIYSRRNSTGRWELRSINPSSIEGDDTSIFCSHKDANHLVSIGNNELAKIIMWLKVNELSLNLTKTNFMIFHPMQKKVNVNVPLTLENTVIKQVTETKFLGVLIDQHLSWNPHINFTSKKILKSVEIIVKVRFYLSSQTLMTLYYSLEYPFLTYCNVTGSSAYCFNPKRYLAFAKVYRAAHNKSSLSSQYHPFI